MDTPRRWQVASLATAVTSLGIGGLLLSRPSVEPVAPIVLDASPTSFDGTGDPLDLVPEVPESFRTPAVVDADVVTPQTPASLGSLASADEADEADDGEDVARSSPAPTPSPSATATTSSTAGTTGGGDADSVDSVDSVDSLDSDD